MKMKLPFNLFLRRDTISRGLVLLAVLSLCVSCAPLSHRLAKSSCTTESVLNVPHKRAQQRADCLGACVEMVMQYYGVNATIPDSTRPLELVSLSHRLNAEAVEDSRGFKLFAAVLQVTPQDLASHIADGRPLILVYKPGSQEVYHSLVISGYCPESGKFYAHDPARRKARWMKLARIPTFMDSGKHLALLVGLHSQ